MGGGGTSLARIQKKPWTSSTMWLKPPRDEPNPREVERMKNTTNQRGGIYSLAEDVELKVKLSTLTRRMEELEMRNQQEVRAVIEIPVPL